ncbi:hypothetical protein [Aromatoleum diolicum]|uniref:Uncharacterized protein n=1 Tax=Aromatoleum diolicum TaxID=75796 RepID=A0ABX1Q949_9RHOO|nr:hypothetical protein [Aromatoleum diolicum]NMG73709.1 hypothetical protein [Aromatoleum diolicum]
MKKRAEKNYFSLQEAADLLSTPTNPFNEQDILDLAMRGELRVTFFFQGELQRFRSKIGGGYADPSDDDSEEWHVSMKGYFLVPASQITPTSREFVIDDMQLAESPIYASRAWQIGSWGYVLAAYSWDGDDVVHRAIRVDVSSVLVPRSDIEALTTGMHVEPARVLDTPPTRNGVSASSKPERGPDINGLVSWQRVLLECWPKIADACNGDPPPRQAMNWLKKNGPRDVIPADQPDGQRMRWIGCDGTIHSVALKTIQSRFSEWKSAGNFPPEK